MTKSLSDRIALYADKNKSPAKLFLPAFIALKPDIFNFVIARLSKK
ncbi:MAG: hypothetical protein LM517_05155 [Nitrosomonas sp.]|nr:hypothetical protein [Nitrosomonas sp.]